MRNENVVKKFHQPCPSYYYRHAQIVASTSATSAAVRVPTCRSWSYNVVDPLFRHIPTSANSMRNSSYVPVISDSYLPHWGITVWYSDTSREGSDGTMMFTRPGKCRYGIPYASHFEHWTWSLNLCKLRADKYGHIHTVNY